MALPAGGGADPTSAFSDRASDLRAENASIAARSSSALLGLYALDSRLARTRAELAAIRRRAAALERRRSDVRLRLGIARRALAVSQQQLADRLRVLYVQGETDPVAVLLGAESLDDALARIDELDRSARLNESVLAQARAARRALAALANRLALESEHVRRLESAAAASAASLTRALADRRAYIRSLAARRQLNARQIASLEVEAAAAHTKTQALAAQPRVSLRVEPVDIASGQTVTVVATGYSMPGHTATGLRVGWGVVAVDPSMIPLGTTMTIPGYGQGVAADIGSSVRGASIDLWFPTRAQAFAWGRRTVTITLH